MAILPQIQAIKDGVACFISLQPFWAQRLETFGVAPVTLPRETLTSSALTKVITVAASTEIRERALTVATMMQNENGVDTAIKALRSFGLSPARLGRIDKDN
ncbi:hypothetical protein MSP8887_03595 [Marinomonas spartinae]|uniref:hypothetical protein n=1 Tax=Marinomonas spartinae TaxID=1792290 RepID=UPI000808E26F|nr:hypothetical protein [Marinomonas spartinae]SBS38995.1 hypothetical protein MSP8887_03595 [Marinomonas spartinae]